MNSSAVIKEINKGDYKYVFVCGLHRSGTTVLGRIIARFENCTGFRNTPRFLGEEGQLLQDVYPVDTEFGGVGRFGFDPHAHLTETSSLLTPENVAKLRASWHSFWDKDKTICVEKTPANILMTRFLQTAFPNSYFIVVRRHPVAVSMATQKIEGPGIIWKVRRSSLHRLFEHWLHCHEIFEQDKKYLRNLYELSYEDYIGNPVKYHREIAAFIGTRVPDESTEEVTGAHNKKYLGRWYNLLRDSFFKSYYRYITRKYESRFANYGYSLTDGFATDEMLRGADKVSPLLGTLFCLAADVGAFFRRFATLSPKEQVKQLLPEFILGKVRRLRHRAVLRKKTRVILS